MREPDMRRRMLVDRRFQVGVSLQIVGYVYFYLVLFALLANFTALKTVLMAESTESPDYAQAVERLKIFAEVLLVPLVFAFVCMCLHGILFSHRIAGPVYRFKETLRRMRKGDLAGEVNIRRRDYFQDICAEMNGLVEGLRTDLSKFRELSGELAREGEDLARDGDLPTEARERLLHFANASSRLRQLVEGYDLGGERAAEEPEAAPERVIEGA